MKTTLNIAGAVRDTAKTMNAHDKQPQKKSYSSQKATFNKLTDEKQEVRAGYRFLDRTTQEYVSESGLATGRIDFAALDEAENADLERFLAGLERLECFDFRWPNGFITCRVYGERIHLIKSGDGCYSGSIFVQAEKG